MVSKSPVPAHPVLLGLYHVVSLSDDRVQIANAGRSVVLSGEGLSRRILPLLDALDGRTGTDELSRRFPDLMPDVLEGLAEKELLTDGRPPESGRVDLDAAAAISLERAPAATAEALSQATVAVAGCGPVGGMVATLLARAAVGHLLLCDPRPATRGDISLLGTPASAGRGHTRGDLTRVLCSDLSDTRAEIASPPRHGGLDERPSVRLAVVEVGYEEGDRFPPDAEACLRNGIPYLLHTQDALEAIVGPLVGGPGSPCHHCARNRLFSNLEGLDEYRAYRAHRSAVAPHPDASLAAHVSLVAGVAAAQALQALAGATPFCSRGALVIDLQAMTIAREVILPLPNCPSCSA